jgi:hypothetical protein
MLYSREERFVPGPLIRCCQEGVSGVTEKLEEEKAPAPPPMRPENIY